MQASPTSIALNSAGDTASFSVSETSYTGAFNATASPQCAGIASVAPSSSNPSQYVVTAGSKAGTCSITVGDSYGQHLGIGVTVTITQGSIQ